MNPELDLKVNEAQAKTAALIEEMSKLLIGQKHVADSLVMGLLVGGHVLLEGLPGLAKTTSVKALAESSNLAVKRIQFTPDLLPADVIGTQIYDPKEANFKTRRGPVFTNLLIADEINRAPAKVQSALLEAMQEKQVTIGESSYKLDQPFLVMATQNPIEQEGTYPLPEAQMDRFLFKILVSYSSKEDEKKVMQMVATRAFEKLNQVISKEEILDLQAVVRDVHVSDKIRDYILDIVFSTRSPSEYGLSSVEDFIEVGASPRASINLETASKARALLNGRSYVTPQDIKDVGVDILRHRLKLSYEAEAEGVSSDMIVKQIFDTVAIP